MRALPLFLALIALVAAPGAHAALGYLDRIEEETHYANGVAQPTGVEHLAAAPLDDQPYGYFARARALQGQGPAETTTTISVTGGSVKLGEAPAEPPKEILQ